MDSSFSTLKKLLDAISAVSKGVPTEMGRRPHQMRPIRTTFVHLRAYYGKVYYLAKYICDEEEYLIQAVEEGKVEDIQDFLGEVVGKTENCKKDLETLVEYLETERQTLLQQDGVVINTGVGNKRKENAMSTKIIGTGIAIIGVVVITVSGIVAINSNDGIGSHTIAGLITGSAFTFVGGILIVIKGSSTKSKNQDEEQDHVKSAIKQMKLFFSQSESMICTANNNLKETNVIQPQLQDSRSVKNSLVQAIRCVTESARSLKEYCQEFNDASSLEHFILCHTNNTIL